jgi:hypothetical protein
MSKKSRPWTRQQRRRIRWRTERPIRRRAYMLALIKAATASAESLFRLGYDRRAAWTPRAGSEVLNWPPDDKASF